MTPTYHPSYPLADNLFLVIYFSKFNFEKGNSQIFVLLRLCEFAHNFFQRTLRPKQYFLGKWAYPPPMVLVQVLLTSSLTTQTCSGPSQFLIHPTHSQNTLFKNLNYKIISVFNRRLEDTSPSCLHLLFSLVFSRSCLNFMDFSNSFNFEIIGLSYIIFYSCSDSCFNSCSNFCPNSCSNSCSNSCFNFSSNSCYYSCSNSCSTSCSNFHLTIYHSIFSLTKLQNLKMK